MLRFVIVLLAYLRGFVLSRHRLGLENVALRQPLTVLKRERPRPRLHRLDRLFWVALRQLWLGWSSVLLVVPPETVVSWHQAGFRLFWRGRSRWRKPGRPPIGGELRQLIRRRKADHPSGGAPRLPGERQQRGFNLSEPTVSRYWRRLKRRGDPDAAKRWLTFLHNHREVIAAIDFLTVPTFSFRALYCFFAIEHGRRRILHFQATTHPNSDWVMQQLREAFPLPCPYRCVILDRDTKFDREVLPFLRSSGLEPIRTSVRSPWQNGVPERWVGSIRREMLDHVIPHNEFHLRRLVRDYLAYYHQDRTHDGLGKQTPANDPRPSRSDLPSRVVGLPRLGGLHHR